VVCYVTDRRGLAGSLGSAEPLLLKRIEQAARAGVDWIQLREPDLSARELAALAEEALSRAGAAGRLLINDRLDVACVLQAAGVHLGEKSLPTGEAKRLAKQRRAGEFLVGVSVHSLQAARQAEDSGADYMTFGPVFATPAKAQFGPPQGIEKLKQICDEVKIPVLAIGGITAENARHCLEAGASGIAAIRLFQEAGDLRGIVKRLRGA
jgi:thiamine-phosphate pyrophosphorylase